MYSKKNHFLYLVQYRVGIEVPKIEVRYENVSVEGDVHVGRRSLPTLLNATLNAFEVYLFCFSNI
jgi:hypothetical protein